MAIVRSPGLILNPRRFVNLLLVAPARQISAELGQAGAARTAAARARHEADRAPGRRVAAEVKGAAGFLPRPHISTDDGAGYTYRRTVLRRIA